MAVRAVRGAIQIEDNTEYFIDDGVKRLIIEIINKNKIEPIFSTEIKSRNTYLKQGMIA